MATDTHDGLEFVLAIESKDYPISGVMFHPETQNRHIVAAEINDSIDGKVNSEKTEKINFHFSKYVHERAKANLDQGHKFSDKDYGLRMEWMNTNTGLTGNPVPHLISFGFN